MSAGRGGAVRAEPKTGGEPWLLLGRLATIAGRDRLDRQLSET